MSLKNSVTTSDYLNFDTTLTRAMKISKTANNYKLGFLIVFGIKAGLRISDILKLKNNDLKNDSISLTESKTNKKRVIRLNDNIKKLYALLSAGSPETYG